MRSSIPASGSSSAAIGRRLREVFRAPAMAAGVGLVAGYVLLAAIAPWIAPYDPNAQNLLASLQPPSPRHWFGTDDLGRDLASRVVVAARADLAIVVLGTAMAVAIALPAGLAAGFGGGATDRLLTGVADAALTFPSLVLAVVLVSLFGAGLPSVVLAVGLTTAPALARLIRSLVLGTAGAEYVQAARALGAGPLRLLRRHVVPNIAGRAIVYTTLMGSYAMLTVTALGFLGLGVQPPAAEWGNMLATTRTYLGTAPWLLAAPGVAIVLFIFGVNALGDALRDLFDPKLLWRP
jgi:ABC-type dipeptide/oligopeptide/nickel transport system permease subunit